jgi:hypothetical protein
MATELSYTITLENINTEKEGINYVLSHDKRLRNISKESRKSLLELLEIPNSYRRSFDLIMLPNHNTSLTQIKFKDDVVLVELKTTKKKLINNPKGFFFGATENEFKLARIFGNKYLFCFVCLHPEARSFSYLTLSELENIIKTKRTQFQINLEN